MKYPADSKIRIMVVEGDVQVSAFIAETLREQGFETIIVSESCRAIDIAESRVPHAFLLNLALPPPDGFKLCRMLRNHWLFRQTPILIITGLNQTDSKIVAIGAGASSYLSAPFSADELIWHVHGLFGE